MDEKRRIYASDEEVPLEDRERLQRHFAEVWEHYEDPLREERQEMLAARGDHRNQGYEPDRPSRAEADIEAWQDEQERRRRERDASA